VFKDPEKMPSWILTHRGAVEQGRGRRSGHKIHEVSPGMTGSTPRTAAGLAKERDIVKRSNFQMDFA
jgi:hypothetical protein